MSRATFVGRAAELAVLAGEAAEAIAAREVRAVLVVGEAGAGKSRLLDEFTGDLGPNVTVLSSRAGPLGSSEPMGLWGQAVDGFLRPVPDDEVVRLCGGLVDDLAGLSRRAAAVAGRAASPVAPQRLFEGLGTVLARLAAAGPVVVILDDVHLADASSWEALHYMAGGVTDTPVLVVAAARPAELARHPAGRSVAFALEQQGRLRRVPVGPLDDEALRAR